MKVTKFLMWMRFFENVRKFLLWLHHFTEKVRYFTLLFLLRINASIAVRPISWSFNFSEFKCAYLRCSWDDLKKISMRLWNFIRDPWTHYSISIGQYWMQGMHAFGWPTSPFAVLHQTINFCRHTKIPICVVWCYRHRLSLFIGEHKTNRNKNREKNIKRRKDFAHDAHRFYFGNSCNHFWLNSFQFIRFGNQM